ncbi:sirohydrochlorin chelatase [Rhodococcus sp. KBS0724]|uniref:sirohydrochlorin chelatase n=1 Tax=Rhodococcus sp. KBS0724 TaxID=1179674 RepID=UPI00110DA36C|nr:sirohydrochlorin chelatase [Rhodococcus sp. KBS0724]TSD46532.1 sirohydrochlorin chelatase [Rhodococcus sp. KBS0724]
MVPLIAVAHGSRDPRSARVIAAAVAALREARPDLDVRLAFLDLNAPSIDQVLDGVAVEGYTQAVVVPMLLGNAFHARVDLPGLLAAAALRHPQLAVTQSDVLGRDVRLAEAVRERILEAGAHPDDPSVGVALAAVGSSDADANAATTELAAVLLAGTNWSGVRICFATSAEPTVAQAISALEHDGAERIVVAPWFLAPGLLTDRLSTAATAAFHGTVFADTIGAHTLLVETMIDRYTTALGTLPGRLVRSA